MADKSAAEPPRPRPARPEEEREAHEDEFLLFSRFVREHEGEIFTYLLRMVGRRADAEDLTAETFLRAFRTWRQVAPEDPEGYIRWCLRIAHNLAVDHCRKLKPRLLEEDDLERVAERHAPSPEEIYESRWRAEKIKECVLELPEKYRAPLLLRFQSGLSYEQIAETLRISQAAVETHIHRGRKMLREKLKRVL